MNTKRWRLLLFGACAGAAIGCHRAALENDRQFEHRRAADPNATGCGLSAFAEVAVGCVWAVPGGLFGLAAGAIGSRWVRFP